MLLVVIATCEVLFWVVLALGLVARYPMRRPRLGAVLLTSTPLVDLILLSVTVADVHRGATATLFHAVAAVYLGSSVAFGPSLIRWADGWFAHRFAGAPRPRRPARTGTAHARRLRQGWYRHLTAWLVGTSVALIAVAIGGDVERGQAFLDIVQAWAVVLAVDFVLSFSFTLWPRRPADNRAS